MPNLPVFLAVRISNRKSLSLTIVIIIITIIIIIIVIDHHHHHHSLSSSLPSLSSSRMTLIPAEFEKDDDSNHHIDFIAACANLRAEVYTITTTDRATIKKIAGKIIPAISTTTAFVTGGIAVELYKINAGLKKIENYRSCFANLSMPMICFSEPGSCRRYTYGGKEWTNWDHLVFTKEDGRSIDDLADWVEAKYNVALDMIAIGSTSLYMGG